MATSYTQPTQAMQLLAPDIAQEQNQLSRRQMMADLLRKQSLESSGPTETIGGWAIKKSPFEGLSKMAQALSANYIQDKTDSRQLELAKALQGRMGDILGGGGGAAPQMENRTNDDMGPQMGTPAPQAPGAAAPQNNFTMANLLKGQVIGDLGGQGASAAYWDSMKATEAAKRGKELGYTISEDRKNEDQKRVKENYIAPTRLGEGAYNDPVLGVQGLPTAAPPGFINVKGADGTWSTNAVRQGTESVSKSAEAKTTGVAEATPSTVYLDGKPQFSTVANDIRRAKGAPPNAAPPGTGNPPPMSGIPDKNKPNANANELSASRASLKNVTDPASRKALEDHIASLEADQKVYQLPTQPTIPANSTSTVTPQQMPGTIANADAAQKSSADTMHESYAGLQAANSSAQGALDSIKKMKELGAKKNWAQVGAVATGTTPFSTNAAEYEKSRANLLALMNQQLGAGVTDAARATNSESIPDFGKPKPAIADGLTTLENQVIHKQLKGNFLTQHFQAGDSKKYTDSFNGFDQNISPSMVPMLTPILSAPPGPARNALLQKAAKDPAMRARLEWAVQSGLIK